MNRFALTFVDKFGYRILARNNWKQMHFDTQAEGDTYLTALLKNNPKDKLDSIFGESPQFAVTPIECYPSGECKKILN